MMVGSAALIDAIEIMHLCTGVIDPASKGIWGLPCMHILLPIAAAYQEMVMGS